VSVKILFYGRLADAMGPELELDAPQGCSMSELRSRLVTSNPAASQALSGRRIRACVGDAFVSDDYILTPADRVEFLPPVSGG
jgi:molybdopterin converting factor small subunit